MQNAHFSTCTYVQFVLVGMKAVCVGPTGCHLNNENNCVVTPLSYHQCSNPMWDLDEMNMNI